jgi:hypothetical protein
LCGRAERRHARAIEAVRDGPGDEHEKSGRCELGEPEQTEIELAVREVVDLLAERGDAHQRGRRAAEDAREQRDDRPVPQPSVRNWRIG